MSVASLALGGLLLLALQDVRPLPVEDALATKTFARTVPIAISPDGRMVAYTVVDPTRRRRASGPFADIAGTPLPFSGSSLWVTELQTSRAWRVSPGEGSAWGGVWSPDGRQLAFFADSGGAMHLWVWSLRDRRARRIPGTPVRVWATTELASWLPDSRHVVVKLRPAASRRSRPDERGEESSPVVLASAARDSAGPASRYTGITEAVNQWMMADLALVRVSDGLVRTIAREEAIGGHWASPAERAVAYTRRRAAHPGAAGLFDIVVWREGKASAIVESVANELGNNVSWSPTGRSLAIYAAGSYWTRGATERPSSLSAGCFVVDARGGTPVEVCGARWRESAAGRDVPKWSTDGRSLLIYSGDTLWRAHAEDGHAEAVALLPAPITGLRAGPGGRALVAFEVARTREAGLALVSLTSGEVVVLTSGAQRVGPASSMRRGHMSPDLHGEVAVYASEATDRPPELWLARAGQAPRRLTSVNRHLDGYTFGESRLIRWRTADGIEAEGALFLPAGYERGRRYPLIVRTYPDSRGSAFLSAFGADLSPNHSALFTTRGYAVLYPDVPQGWVTPMLDIGKAVLPAVSKVVKMGIADPDRLAVTGVSHGAYSTLALLTLSDRFRTAVVESGTGNLVAVAHMMLDGASGEAWAEDAQGKMRRHLWEVRERYVENSPIFYFDRIRSPVLVLHGDADPTHFTVADETFVALRRLGVEVQYAKYRGQGHGRWTPQAERDVARRILDWYERWFR